MSLRKNVAANYVGQGWRALMGVLFVPLYIRYLGIEAYGLIGIFALLQSWLVLLDIGLKPALVREMARYTAGAHNAQSIRDLLRSIELIGIGIAGAVALVIWGASGWLAVHWVTAKHLPVNVIARSFSAMGLVAALRFIEDIYANSIAGLQRQVLQNTVTAVMATARGVGGICVLVWVSPTITAFFLWQGVVSLGTVAMFAGVLYNILPQAPLPARFSVSALVSVRRFAAGMMALTILSLLLTQVDKILLSRLLSLELFGYYALAGVVAGGLYTLTSPITGAVYPRFTQLAASGDAIRLSTVYHQGAQLVTVLAGSGAVMLMVFGERVIRIWTRNPGLSQKVAPLVAVLALGTLFNTLIWMPYQLQLANGWTSLTVKINAVAVCLLVPAIVMVVPAYGAIGAAWAWVTLNACYVIFEVSLMHRRLLRTEKWRWYSQDVALPLGAAAATALLCRWVVPNDSGRIGEACILVLTSVCVLMAAVLAAPMVRVQFGRYLPGMSRSLRARTV